MSVYSIVDLGMERRFAVSWALAGLVWVSLCTLGFTPLFAAETYYVASKEHTLNVWSGPGMEYSVVSRLPRGARVMVHERWGQWAKITSDETKGLEGWVLLRDLTSKRPGVSKQTTKLDREQEQRRFARLRRKGVLGVQRMGSDGILRLSISPLVWYRLTPYHQANFLRRARQFFGGSVVEMRDRRNAALMARLSAADEVEFALHPTAVPPVPNDTTSTSPQVEMSTSGGTGSGR